MGEILHTIAINAKRKHVYVGKLFEQKFLVNKAKFRHFFPNTTKLHTFSQQQTNECSTKMATTFKLRETRNLPPVRYQVS